MRAKSISFLRLLALLALVPLAGLAVHPGCGGGVGGVGDARPEPEPVDDLIQLVGEYATLTLDARGRLVGAQVASLTGDAAPAEPQPILELVAAGEVRPLDSVRYEAGVLVASFEDSAHTARVAVESQAGSLVFRVEAIESADVEALRLHLTFRRLDEVDPPLNGTYDDDAVLCLRSVDATTRCVYASLPGGIPRLGVEWSSVHGIVGGSAALIAGSRAEFFDLTSRLQIAEGLPSPRFDGVPARVSPTVRKSYLFLTYYQLGDLPALLEYARIGEFGLILLLRGLWRESAGTYDLDPALWPGGLPEFEGFCEQIRDAGLGVGLHLYGPMIAPDDPLVTPVPADGLLSWACPPLAADVSAAETELFLTGALELPPAAAGGFPGKTLRVGHELIRYTSASPTPPFVLSGCERGAHGTTAASHAAGDVPRHLALLYGLFLIDPDGPLVEIAASNLAQVVNAAQVEMVYFDGCSVPTNDHVQRWYYMNRLLPAYDAAFDHSVLVQTGLGPGRDLDWHLVPRSASADGHGDIKWYLDERTPSVETIRRGFSVPDVGWYGFDAGRPPDYLEYVCAKCLGWECGLSVQTFRVELETDRRARETMEMIGRYERLKRTGGLPPSVRDALLEPGHDFRLLEDESGARHLYEVTYDAPRDIRTLIDGAHTWTMGNPAAADRLLGIEITRGDAVRADADWTAAGVTTLEPFLDLAPYTPSAENDSARLVNRTGKVMNDAGPARSGVEHDWQVVPDPSVGGACAALTATNPNTTIGWCAVGRTFEAPLDVSSYEALGLWVKGDKSGVELTLELWDDQDRRAVFRVPVFFEGWRYHTWPLVAPFTFDRTQVRGLILIAADIAPGSDIEVCLASLRAAPTMRPASSLMGGELQVGERSIPLPAPLPPGGTARIDGLGRLTLWPGGMAEGQTWELVGGPVSIAPGTHTLRLSFTGPDPFPGDVTVRTSRLVQIHAE